MKSTVANVVALAAILLLDNVHGIRWYLNPNTQKCLRSEVQADVSVTGEYEVSEVPGQRVDYVIHDSKGHILSQRENIQHGKLLKLSFSTDTYELIEICFTSQVPPQQRGMKQEVYLVLKRGIEAKSYEGIAEAAKLKPIEVELKRLEDLSEVIVQDFARMRKNEEDLRNTNEATNARVLYFSIFSMCCLLTLATWQVFYLRRFFRAKKLIE